MPGAFATGVGWAALLAAAALPASVSAADLDVALAVEYDTVLQFEPVMVFVTITNDSGTALIVDSATLSSPSVQRPWGAPSRAFFHSGPCTAP